MYLHINQICWRVLTLAYKLFEFEISFFISSRHLHSIFHFKVFNLVNFSWKVRFDYTGNRMKRAGLAWLLCLTGEGSNYLRCTLFPGFALGFPSPCRGMNLDVANKGKLSIDLNQDKYWFQPICYILHTIIQPNVCQFLRTIKYTVLIKKDRNFSWTFFNH